MRENFAPVDLRQAVFNFPNEPIVIVNEGFNGSARQRLRIRTPLAGKARELCFHFRRQIHFHAVSLADRRSFSIAGRAEERKRGPEELSARMLKRADEAI